MKKQHDFKKGGKGLWFIMLLFAVSCAVNGMGNYAVAANNDIMVDSGGVATPNTAGVKITAAGNITGVNNITTTGNETVGGNLNVTGSTSLQDRLSMNGNNINMSDPANSVTGGSINMYGGNVNMGSDPVWGNPGNINMNGGNVNMADGNINSVNNLTVNGNTALADVSARSDSGYFGLDVNDSLAQIGYSDGSTTNGLQATNLGVAATSTDFSTYSSTLSLDSAKAYISYYDEVNNIENGLAADAGNLNVGSTNYITGTTSGLSTDGTDLIVGYTDPSIGTVGGAYGLHANNGEVNVGYVEYSVTGPDNFHGLTVDDTQTTLSGGTTSTTLTLNDSGASLDNRLLMNGNNINMGGGNVNTIGGNVNLDGGNLNTGGGNVNMAGGNINGVNNLTVNGNTTLADVSARSDSGYFGLDVNDSLAQIGYSDGSTTNGLQATNLGVAATSTDFSTYSSTLSLDSAKAYISYYNPGATTEYGLVANNSSVSVGSANYSTGDQYALIANDSSVFVGSTIGAVQHGLTVNGTQTTLSGGTSSSVWTLADGQADLSVDGEQIFTATNSGTATDVTISSDTLTVTGDATVNGTLTADGLLTANGGATIRSDNTSFGLDVNDTNAQIGYQSGTLTNGLQATSGGVVLSSTDTAAYSSTVRLDGTQAYISYNNGTMESGLEAGTSGVAVGTISGTTSYGLQADGSSVFVGSDIGGLQHGLTVDATQTTLSGGTNSSVWTLADSQADLSVDGEQIFTATNSGTATDIAIDSDTFTVNGATTINNTLDVIGTTNINNSGTADTNIGNTTGSVGITGSAVNINGATTIDSNGTSVAGGSRIVVSNTQITSLTSDDNGLTVNNGGAVSLMGGGNTAGLNINATGDTVSLMNNVGTAGHGLTIGPTSTTLSGGTTSTVLTLDNNGAAFTNSATGGPARVTGIFDGSSTYDAVNFGQLQKAYMGVASVSALAAIPGTMPGKRFAIGAGYGYFENESAVAIGLKASILDSISVTAGVGIGVGHSDSTYTANAGVSYSF